jgi:hypothetical protein
MKSKDFTFDTVIVESGRNEIVRSCPRSFENTRNSRGWSPTAFALRSRLLFIMH